MIQWLKVQVEETCGLCGKRIYQQQPAQAIKLDALRGTKRLRFRCVDCVGPAPPDLPDHIELTPLPKLQPKPLASIAASFSRARLSEVDWSNRLTGERE